MKRISEADILSAVSALRGGGIAVLRTDTIYGIVARADDEKACKRVYAAKGRDGSKPCIVLVADETQIWDDASRQAFAEAQSYVSNEPTSIVVPAGENTPTWIPHGNGTVAFRLPTKPMLRVLLKVTGPMIAPSANPSGAEPASTIKDAERYFMDAVDIYIDGGEVRGAKPSRIIKVDDSGRVEQIR